MASEYSFARGVSLPAHRPPLAFTSYRLRHGAAVARANRRVVAARAARPVSVGAARRMPGSVRYGGAGVAALRVEEAGVAVPPSVPVRVAYELQLAGHRYLDVRTEGEFAGGHPAGAVNVPYMYSTGSGMAKNSHFVEQVSAIFRKDDEIIVVRLPLALNVFSPFFFQFRKLRLPISGMPKWQEVSHGSSRTLLRWLHCRDRHRRRVFDLERERAAGQWTVTSRPEPL
ncbi:uncharacterized protein [Triticum aestivum]|uniref:uncharacterized protein isoform X1 n=1 Tax=Triticum aestivum TaxID=4565 RepID=UPI0008439A2B|nr:uncharacterized protein LOC778416 isoform X1 [Triticum aestivum]